MYFLLGYVLRLLGYFSVVADTSLIIVLLNLSHRAIFHFNMPIRRPLRDSPKFTLRTAKPTQIQVLNLLLRHVKVRHIVYNIFNLHHALSTGSAPPWDPC